MAVTPSTALIICARAPRRVLPVPAVREGWRGEVAGAKFTEFWRCSWCGARVKVVA